MNKDLQVGDRVTLSPDSSWNKPDSLVACVCNPLGVEGVVDAVHTWVDVTWDNGEWNSYSGADSDLIKVEE
ncbi:hypothetical protein NVP1121O_087 [Vibrio phage 1.121.O._10N.286.46.C4]|nr:hypothetical protein NVP1121O_087 [Vibrio phage 1.121.O._10N.286.46.C4]